MEATYDSPAHDPVFFFLAHGRHRKRNILFKYARWSKSPFSRCGQTFDYPFPGTKRILRVTVVTGKSPINVE